MKYRYFTALIHSHAERLTQRQMGYNVKPDGSFAVVGGGANIRLFSGTGQDDDPPGIHYIAAQ
ncbi:MAG: hypothetical protein AAB676_07095 [Verrucomicrobiota bacterium]